MENNQNNNRRALVGALILILLVGANLLVRYSRSSRNTQPAPAAGFPAVVPQPAPTFPSADIESHSLIPPVSPATASESDLLLPAGAVQMAAISSKLQQMWQDLTNLDAPLPAPDLAIKLQLSDYDRFRWKLALPIASETPIIEPDVAIATPTVTRSMEILGVFTVKGRSKYLVREEDKVFLINEGEETRPESIVVERTGSDSYLVYDSTGSSHDLQLKRQSDHGIENALKVLRGMDTGQPFFRFRPASTASAAIPLNTIE